MIRTSISVMCTRGLKEYVFICTSMSESTASSLGTITVYGFEACVSHMYACMHMWCMCIFKYGTRLIHTHAVTLYGFEACVTRMYERMHIWYMRICKYRIQWIHMHAVTLYGFEAYVSCIYTHMMYVYLHVQNNITTRM